MAKPKYPNYETIVNIRRLYECGQFKQSELAIKFGLSQSSISKIINKNTHANIDSFNLGGEALVKVGYKHGN